MGKSKVAQDGSEKKPMHLEFFIQKIWRIWKHWIGTIKGKKFVSKKGSKHLVFLIPKIWPILKHFAFLFFFFEE